MAMKNPIGMQRSVLKEKTRSSLYRATALEAVTKCFEDDLGMVLVYFK